MIERRAIIITGGSSGIGEAVAIRFARRGDWAILLAGRTKAKLATAVEKCRELTNAALVDAVDGDICDDLVRAAIVSRANEIGKLCAVVNSAGIGSFGMFHEMTRDKITRMLDVNVVALLSMCQLTAPCLSRNGGGTIVNIGSDADQVGFKGGVGYCGAKGAVLAASRSLQVELRPLGIRVTVVSPGRVDTHFNEKRPGMRPGALTADEVAEVVEFAIVCGSNIELTEIRLDSVTRPYR